MSEFLPQIPVAFASGLISVLSPCVLPLMPAYLSLISGVSVAELSSDPWADRTAERHAQRLRVMEACFGFCAGFSLVFIVLGASAFALGRVLRSWSIPVAGFDVGIAQLAGLVIIVFGLQQTGLLRISWLLRDTRFAISGTPGFGGAFLVGAGFGFGWSPCIGPILGAVLTLAASRDTVFQGIALLAIYSAGLAVPFLVAGYSLDAFFRAFARIKRHFRTLEVASGVLLIGVGLLLLTNQLAWFNGRFAFLGDLVVAAEDWLQ